MNLSELVARGTILRATVGSTVHGLHHGGRTTGTRWRSSSSRPSEGKRNVNRPELVEAHGFDTKYAMHAVRLGYQGLELLETGRLTLPMPEPTRSRVMAVRLGERSFDEVLAEIDEVQRRLSTALEQTALPAEPDRAAVDRFLVDTYRQAWGWR